MKIYTSYFYQIRFFKTNMIPLSTAVWDPAWFHANQGYNYQYKDKRGIWNGLRAEPFTSDHSLIGECQCGPNCKSSYLECKFLKDYEKYLDTLNFNEIMQRFNILEKKIQEVNHTEEELDMVLIVYEPYYKKCSERTIIHKWFKKHNYPIQELSYPIGGNTND